MAKSKQFETRWRVRIDYPGKMVQVFDVMARNPAEAREQVKGIMARNKQDYKKGKIEIIPVVYTPKDAA